METRQCSVCKEFLPATANYCSYCGDYLTSPEHNAVNTPAQYNDTGNISTLPSEDQPAKRKSSKGYFPSFTKGNALTNIPWRRSFTDFITSSFTQDQQESQEVVAEDAPPRELTWQKVVETPSNYALVAFPPRPRRPPQSHTLFRYLPFVNVRIPPIAFFWISLVLLLALIGAGLTSSVSFGQSALHHATVNTALSLQVTPHAVTIGATITLRGTNFNPRGHVGLTRDTAIPIADTGGSIITTADSQGKLTDTVTVSPDWGHGAHVINAEDAVSHKIASFPITINGDTGFLRPAHLGLSQTNLDMGTGDQAVNTIKTVSLINVGDGQINWQSVSSEPWLLVSPRSGMFTTNMHSKVTIAVDRSNMQPGSYASQILFTSSAGDVTLPVSALVTPLAPGHEAVLQLSPAVLSFTASDGGQAPAPQTITVRNPGVLPLHWKASTDANWLSVSSTNTTIPASGSGIATVYVNTSSLLPGTYSGMINFSGQGSNAVLHSPQSVYVSITIQPRCTLQTTPGMLTFTSAYLQPDPAAKTIAVETTGSCTGTLSWSATSNAKWLTLSTTHGTTPQNLQVGIAVAGLQPGVYNSSITLNSAAGTQVLLVNFTMGQPTQPIMSIAQASLGFSAIPDQSDTAPKIITLTNTGGGTLSWQSSAQTSSGGTWLSVTPQQGSLSAHQSISLSVNPQILGSMTPGTYTGTINIIGTDSAGHPATGGSQSLPIIFVVKPPCTVAVVPGNLTFSAVYAQAAPTTQAILINVSGTCANTLNWSAVANTTGGTWLNTSATTGTASLAKEGSVDVVVSLAGLVVGQYQGTVTIATVDSVTRTAIGATQTIPVTLNVQAPCTLQASSSSIVTFTTEPGVELSTQTVGVKVTGTCIGNSIVAATVAAGASWLTVTPANNTVLSGGTATFTLQVNISGLPAGGYTASLSLAALNGGVTIAGSPQTVSIVLNIRAAPVLTVSPASITFNVTTGQASQAVSIGNTGASPLNWTAVLQSGAPSFITLSSTAGNNLNGSANQSITVSIDATGIAGGQYTASLLISAIDPLTQAKTAGSPLVLPITINVTPATLQVSSQSLSFITTVGMTPSAQSIGVTNAGGGTLAWSVGSPSQSWLLVSPTSGSAGSGFTSLIQFSVNTANLATNTYSATVIITPTNGAPITITVSLLVNIAATTPTIVAPTLTPTGTVQPLPVTPVLPPIVLSVFGKNLLY